MIVITRKFRLNDVVTPLTEKVSKRYNNWLVYVTYYVDNTFAAEATPTSGTTTVIGTSHVASVTAPFLNSPLDATAPSTFSSMGTNLSEITVTPDGIIGAGAMEVVIVGQD